LQSTAGRHHAARSAIGLLDPQTAFDVGRRVSRPEADAVMLACGNRSTFSIIDQLERDLGKPVLTTNQVSLWHALKIMKRRPQDTPAGEPGLVDHDAPPDRHRFDGMTVDQISRCHQQNMRQIYDQIQRELGEAWRRR